MPTIIGCDSFLSLRNVRNGNLGRLIPGLHVWVDPNQLGGSRDACPEGVALDALVDFDMREDPALAALFATHYEARKAYGDPRTYWSKSVRSSETCNAARPWRRAASVGMAGLRFTRGWVRGAAGHARADRQACAEALRRHPGAEEYARRFAALQPDVVAGFSLDGPREMLLLEAANAAGIPTAVMIRSRDNLAAKIQHLPDARVYLVWSEQTRRFLLRLYPEIDPERVVVTGSPQFDRHPDPAYRMERGAFFRLVDLDPDRPLVVYTMATPGLIPHETDIAQHLADAAHAGRLARRAQLLVRGHPRMFGSDLRLLRREYPEARCFPAPTGIPYRSPAHEAVVVKHILEDEAVHLSTLAYQDVQVNVCGTMTIDSAILDKPTVNVCYDLVPRLSAGHSVRRFYERSDARQMISYGASRLARSAEECLRWINAYLENPSLDAAGRQRACEEDCGPLDGQAGERIAMLLRAMHGPAPEGMATHATRS